MSYFSSCNGLQIVGGDLFIPAVGAWAADIQLAGQDLVNGPAVVVIGNLTLNGYVYRADSYGGQVKARLVGGYGGWRQSVQQQGYGSAGGVLLSTVLGDVASSCGEKIAIANDATIGNAFVRVNFGQSVASDVLWQMVAQKIIPAWYVAPSGITQTKAWPSNTISTPFTVTKQNPDEGLVEIATEDYASWMPGCSFTAPQLQSGQTFTSAGVRYTWTPDGKARFEVLTGTAGDRLLGPLQSIVQKEVAPLRFFGRYSYTIHAATSTTIDGSPVDQTLGLPDVQNVTLTADSIGQVTPAVGAVCHVMFVNGQPTQPVCVWCEADASTGPTAAVLAPNQSNVQPLARVGDTVVVAFPPLMQAAGTVSGAPFVGVLTITTPALGIIQTGSPVVSSG